ncbi:MAG: CDP-glycerol glycerophosphotransferase family protein [Gammaproteobacteria bacterium]|nr:CDP-glycerol glycerophosphotransferase family protein [Gammaproteobacteria bacterium]
MKTLRRFTGYALLLLARLYLFPIYLVSGFVPRRDDLWVFGSWGGYRFADNSAAFFNYCQEKVSDRIRLVWISREKHIVEQLSARGVEAHWIWSPRGIGCCLRAGLYLFDSFSKDINFWTCRGARRINLWSGVPLKAFERDIATRDSRYYRLFHGTWPERALLSVMMPWHVHRPHMIIATSPETARITDRAFDLEPDVSVVTGYPRNDVLFGSGSAVDASVPPAFQDALNGGRHVFMYLPTYRDSGAAYFDVDWAELDELMDSVNGSFFFKFHPDDESTFCGKGHHVHELEQGSDIYRLMAMTNTLISDYSSIIFDFMLLERAIVYYMPDLADFSSSSRSLIFDPQQIAVGPVCHDGKQMLSALRDAASGSAIDDDRDAQWSAIRRRFNTYTDGQSCKRVLDVIDRRFLDGRLTN